MRKVDPVKHEARRREILEAAGRCFMRHGFRSASISDICAEGGISAGQLYHYFDGKEAMIEAMIEVDLAQAAEAAGEAHEPADPVRYLVLEFERRATGVKGGPALMFDVFAEATRSPAIAELLRHHSQVMQARIAAQVRRGQALGRVDPQLDPGETATLLLGVMDAAKVLAVREANTDLQPTMRLVERMLGRFLRAAPEDGHEGPAPGRARPS